MERSGSNWITYESGFESNRPKKVTVRIRADPEEGREKSREMGGYVGSTPTSNGSSMGSNPDISQNYKMGDISKGVANTL